MKIKEIVVKSIITKSGIPGIDFVINPYLGCMHGCKYCYAKFMEKFTNKPWDSFVKVKVNAPDLIFKEARKCEGRSLLISSICDPYQPIERKYELTRRILKRLLLIKSHLYLMTKSYLVLRDVDLLKKFKKCKVAISLSIFNEEIKKKLEPLASSVNKRIDTLKELHKAGIPTVLFISPILPGISEWKAIIEKTKFFVDEYWFENLNLYPSIKNEIYDFLEKNKPELIDKYNEIYSKKSDYWRLKETEIEEFCKKNKISHKVYFH